MTLAELLEWAESNRHITPSQKVTVRERAKAEGVLVNSCLPHVTDPPVLIDENNREARWTLFTQQEKAVLHYVIETVRIELEDQLQDLSENDHETAAQTHRDLAQILPLERELLEDPTYNVNERPDDHST